MHFTVGMLAPFAGRLFDGETGMTTITTAVTTGLGTVQSEALSLIGSVLPYALGVLGAVLVVTIGIKVFRKIAGK